MQIKEQCVNCTKSQCVGKNKSNELEFGCNEPFCIFDPIKPNYLREQTKSEYKKYI